MFIIIFFILGLIIGSFLNVLVHRLRLAENLVFDRSKCSHCQKVIRWYDNFPVFSFILLRAHCRDCDGKISWQYPLVEIFTGIIFALIGQNFFILANPDSWFPTAFYLIFSGALISIFVYDWLYMEIPGEILWITVFLAVIFLLYMDWNLWAGQVILERKIISPLEMNVFSGALAAIFAFSLFFAMSFFSREKWMGMGDAYLVILLGLILGWPKIWLALFLAFFLGSIYGIILIVLKKKKMKSRVPFAPFLILGTLLTLFFYVPIVSWYFSFLTFY